MKEITYTNLNELDKYLRESTLEDAKLLGEKRAAVKEAELRVVFKYSFLYGAAGSIIILIFLFLLNQINWNKELVIIFKCATEILKAM